MDVDLLGDPIPPEKIRLQHERSFKGGYPAQPGSGPDGKTCGDCNHYRSVDWGGRRRYPKCALIEKNWTHGPGTDIKKKSPACRLFNYEQTKTG